MTSTPTPAIFADRKQRPVPAPPTRIAAVVELQDPGTIVRPGLADHVVEEVHDGVVKTKHLERGQRVRPYLHGKPCGGERIVDSVERLDDGSHYRVTWATSHPVTEHKAAYRWYDASLDGVTVQRVVKQPALVKYEEV